MQRSTATSVAATAHGSHDWLKNAAKATFLLLFIKGTAWVAAAWLAMRGFPGM